MKRGIYMEKTIFSGILGATELYDSKQYSLMLNYI